MQTNDNNASGLSRLSVISGGLSSKMSQMNQEKFETQFNKRLKQVEKNY